MNNLLEWHSVFLSALVASFCLVTVIRYRAGVQDLLTMGLLFVMLSVMPCIYLKKICVYH